jgi:hypothetical protein
MKRFVVALGILVLSMVAAADDKGVRGTPALTAKEVGEGWLQLFDGESTFGWKVDGESRVEKGQLILGGKKPTKAFVVAPFGRCIVRFNMSVLGVGVVKQAAAGGSETIYRATSDVEGTAYSPLKGGVHSPLVYDIPADTHVVLRHASIQPTKLTPLFDGKDLTGWKQFVGNPKQEKSKFGVTKEGWLNVKNGPGDLQTTKTYGDFVLQLECISNGKHLNSGIFFRCLPGKYQQGYEAQIRNQFTDKPTQKYTVEDYDPTTNKLLGKRTVESTAVDYGTGAIYRRMSARKGVAKDGTWFALTVLARGRHFATWVDGVPVVDWTDNRPANDNARQGYRAAPGAISIQGHDPTTDLSFRAIRIAELTGK